MTDETALNTFAARVTHKGIGRIENGEIYHYYGTDQITKERYTDIRDRICVVSPGLASVDVKMMMEGNVAVWFLRADRIQNIP
jgi:hypothetical protein